MSAKRSGKGGRVTPKGTRPANTRPKIEHHEEVDRAQAANSHGDAEGAGEHGHDGDRGNAPHAAAPRAQGRTGLRGGR